MNRFQNKVALITGATSGIGRMVVIVFVCEGAKEEIVEVVLWLSSDGASFITGQSVAADGGFTAQ